MHPIPYMARVAEPWLSRSIPPPHRRTNDRLQISRKYLITDFITKQLSPWLRTQSALPPGGFGLSGVPDGRFPHDAEQIHSSVVFENFTRELVAWDLALRLDREELDELINQILESIAAELGG